MQEQQNKDFDYFLQNMGKFYEVYGRKFLAIKNLHVLGAYDTFQDAYNDTIKTEEIGTFLIQECFQNREESVQHFQGNVTPVFA